MLDSNPEPVPGNVSDPPAIAVIGGGAAGFFAALTAAEHNPRARITVFEQSPKTLRKVKISGGGRCNVTHHCFDPAQLSNHYPRGRRELRAAFHHWQPQDTVDWFEQRGVRLKTEADGRMFPTTDTSQTIIDCFVHAARKHRVRILTQTALKSLQVDRNGGFRLTTGDSCEHLFNAVCIACGSLKSADLETTLEALGHTIEPLAPSLFAFNIKDPRIDGLAGVAVPDASVKLYPKSRIQRGPLLITHKGMSGPAILKLSAWEARTVAALDYQFEIQVNWLDETHPQKVAAILKSLREANGRKAVVNTPLPAIPRRLWERLSTAAGIDSATPWSQLSAKAERALVHQLTESRFAVHGKTTNKEEFVTCGGVSRKSIDWRRMESKTVPHLHFAGECIDYDGITGGFNFQGAWTTGRIAGLAMAETV